MEIKKLKTPLVSVIIVNWNGRKFIKQCLDSLSKVDYENIEVLFVDNASTDDSVLFVKKQYPKVRLFVNKENLGLGGGHEVALKNVKGEAVLLLNSDTIIQKSLLKNLVKSLYLDKKIGAVQPKLVIYPQVNQIDSIGCFFLPTGNLYHYGREKDPSLPQYNRRMEIFSTKGACMLIKKEVLDKTGLFDEDFFAYYEDTDFCMRIWLAGYKVVYEPIETVFHRGGATSEKIMHSQILLHSYKNVIFTYLKNFSTKYILKILPVTLFLYQIAFLVYLITGKFSSAIALQKGLLWNLANLELILKKRKHVQNNIRIISDDDYVPKLTKRVRLSYYYYQFFGGMEHYKDEEK